MLVYSSFSYIQPVIDFNEMVCYYENLLTSSAPSEELVAAEKIITEIKKAYERDAKRIEQMEKEHYERRTVVHAHEAVIKANEEKFNLLSSELSALKSTSSSLRRDLTIAKAKI